MSGASRGHEPCLPAQGDLPRRVRAARAYAGLSVAQLAARLGVGSKTIKRIEAGTRLPRMFELWGIAEVCDVGREFFTREDPWGAGGALHGSVLERLERIEAAVTTLVEQIGKPQ